MERVTVKQAATELNIDADCLRRMMAHGLINIGIVNKHKNRSMYYIYREWLEEFKRGER